MLQRALQRFRIDHPQLATWFGNRLDLQLPAIGLSVLTHAVILLAFGSLTYAVHTDQGARIFRTEVLETAAPDLARINDTTALAEVDRPTTLDPVAGSFSPNVSALIPTNPAPALAMASAGSAGTSTSLPATMLTEDLALKAVSAPKIALPTATRYGQSVSIQGSGAEHVGGVEGAVDRLAAEILRQLERGRTLVIWAFDASGSLVSERQRLREHIKTVYQNLRKYDIDHLTEDDGLLTVVVSFGHDRRALTPEPISDPEAIADAIGKVPLDTTGVETTFQTVGEIARKWGKFKKGGKQYHAMAIVITDEIGDDEAALEPAIAAANSARMPVFILGSPALFGRVKGFMDYTDPVTGKQYYHLPVDQGPESAMVEMVHIPFWYSGPQYDMLDAGFGPYGLSRLAGATGGIYFVTRMGPNRITFDPMAMREYKPDWVSREQYLKAIARNPLRQAVLQAGAIAQQNLPGEPSLTFPPADTPAFKEAMEKNQTTAARVAYTVDEALEPILRVAKLRDRETSRRWQAHYDLIRGRLLAMKVRCYEYNWACALMKKDPKKFTNPKSNAWRLVPEEEIHYSDKAAAAASVARSLLKQVVTDHPGTPWALLAQRELKDPFGFKWEETYVPPPPKPRDGGGNNAENNNPTPKPPPPPKL